MRTVNFDTEQIIPSKIICVGRNYVEHIQELGNEIPDEMVVFIKPNSAISEHLTAFHLSEPLHYEAELCFLYQNGRFSAVAIGLDLTKRQLQTHLKRKSLPWERAKAFDGSAVFSDFVTLKNVDTHSLALSLKINDEIMQQGSVDLMIYKPEEILNELKTFMTLEDGDIVMTGTPKGVGTINPEDEFLGHVLTEKNELISHQWRVIE